MLAGELARSAHDSRAAFDQYERRMRPFVEKNRRLAPNDLKGMVLASQAQIRLQLLALRVLPHLPDWDRIIGRIAHAIHEAATAIDLETY